MPRSLTPARATVLLSALLGLAVGTGGPAAAAPQDDDLIVLPDASSAEGIAEGRGDTFYAGDLFRGDVFRGDLEERTAELFIDAPDGRMAIGMDTDLRHGLLFVAGGPGTAYVYDTRSGETVATYQLSDPAASFVNDVTVTREGAWFTDSSQPQLYLVPLGDDGELGEASTLALSGPAADTSGEFDLNGIDATRSGGTLVVAHSGNGELYTVDPETGESALIAGVSVPSADGIVLDGRRLWVVQNELNQVSEIRLDRDLSSGRVEEVITDEDFQVPTTAIRYDRGLAVVNAKFDTGLPPTADRYEVVLVDD